MDMKLLDSLYDYGSGKFFFAGLGGLPAPQRGWIIKAIWNEGLASEELHWFGFIDAAEKKQEGNVYAIQAYTLDALLETSPVGEIRNYLAKSPHTIIQAAGTPNPVLVDVGGTTVLPYGTSASVPYKVDGAQPGIVLAQFVADSGSIFDNVRRLCLQSRGSSGTFLFGLEWTVRLEGANNSTPTFYLVERRHRAATGSYTPEVFSIPGVLHRSKRAPSTMAGIEAIRVIGAGHGSSRIQSALFGAGARKVMVTDKGILQTTNADNMAARLADIFLMGTEIVMGATTRHSSPTRCGDFVTVTQSGHANINLRVMMRSYDLAQKLWFYVLGKPATQGRDDLQNVIGDLKTDFTVPQFTDLNVPGQWDEGIAQATVPFVSGGGALPIAAGAVASGNKTAVAMDGNVELIYNRFVLNFDAASAPALGPIRVILEGEHDNSANWNPFGYSVFAGDLQPPGAAGYPLAGEYIEERTFPFPIKTPAGTSTNVTGLRLTIINQTNVAITINQATTRALVFSRPRHRHSEL